MSAFTDIFSLRVLIHLALIRPFLRLFFGVNAVGAEHLADLDQCIIIANHNSHLDVLLLFSILPAKHIVRTHPVAAKEYFSQWRVLFLVVNYLFQPIWVVRDEKAADPLRGIKDRLSLGHNVIIFPEGTRGSPGEIARFKSGVGLLAVEYPDVPIVPAFLFGPEKALPRTSAVPLPLWNEVTIGPPQLFTGKRRDITVTLENLVRDLSECAVAKRHRRRRKPKPSTTVAVLGIDGSGKSTLSRAVTKRLADASSVCLVTDGLEFYECANREEVQPLLSEKVREAIGKYAKTAKSLKHYKVPKLTELLLRDHIMGEAERWYSPDFIVLDGCPLLNLAAWANLYKQEHFDADACGRALRILSGRGDAGAHNDPVFTTFPELAALRRLRLASMKLPDAVIMLDVEPAVSAVRIKRRGEKRQVHETEGKLVELRAGYRLVCDVVQTEFDIPTRILNGDAAIDVLVAAVLAFIEENRGGGSGP
jgi:1-acyl-sn-glycerol-3-phosphate acyltransferase